MKRKRLSKGKSKRLFKRTVVKVNPRNFVGTGRNMRGGIRF